MDENIKEYIMQDESLYSNNLFNRDLLSRVNLKKRQKSENKRERLYSKKYLGEIIAEEKPEFSSNNLIIAPVGSGKSHLIEEMLIPKEFDKKILYLTSNTSLKDSLAPNNNSIRKILAENGQSVKFFTSENKNRFGNRPYDVHVMTYHEFGLRIEAPYQTFTEDVGLIFCDEIHSLPIFRTYANSEALAVATRWLFTKHDNIDIYYFTATDSSILRLEKNSPGHLTKVKEFNYLNHPEIRKYEAKSIYYISHIEQVRIHLRSRLNYLSRHGNKGLAFSRRIKEQYKIKEIAEEEGYTPLILWSINNEEEMSSEQLDARDYILATGNIPEPYNLLIINGAMQEGWNLYDKKVSFAILDTLDDTEQVQALGRIRKDIDFVVYKTENADLIVQSIVISEKYLNKPLTIEERDLLADELNIINSRGNISKWREVSKLIEKAGYTLENKISTVDGKRKRTTIITKT